MTNAEALRIVAMLTAYYRQELSDETAVLWANEIVGFETVDAMEAVTILGPGLRFMPSLMEFRDGIVECRNDRLKREQLALPPAIGHHEYISLKDWLASRPDMQERVAKLGWFKQTLEKMDAGA